jgi:hypothetical protein
VRVGADKFPKTEMKTHRHTLEHAILILQGKNVLNEKKSGHHDVSFHLK